jgi:hypothetical protein
MQKGHKTGHNAGWIILLSPSTLLVPYESERLRMSPSVIAGLSAPILDEDEGSSLDEEIKVQGISKTNANM